MTFDVSDANDANGRELTSLTSLTSWRHEAQIILDGISARKINTNGAGRFDHIIEARLAWLFAKGFCDYLMHRPDPLSSYLGVAIRGTKEESLETIGFLLASARQYG